jgi:hypothetical protein
LETGKRVSRGEAFILTHKKKDGSYMNAEAQAAGVRLNLFSYHSTIVYLLVIILLLVLKIDT